MCLLGLATVLVSHCVEQCSHDFYDCRVRHAKVDSKRILTTAACCRNNRIQAVRFPTVQVAVKVFVFSPCQLLGSQGNTCHPIPLSQQLDYSESLEALLGKERTSRWVLVLAARGSPAFNEGVHDPSKARPREHTWAESKPPKVHLLCC